MALLCFTWPNKKNRILTMLTLFNLPFLVVPMSWSSICRIWSVADIFADYSDLFKTSSQHWNLQFLTLLFSVSQQHLLQLGNCWLSPLCFLSDLWELFSDWWKTQKYRFSLVEIECLFGMVVERRINSSNDDITQYILTLIIPNQM